MSPSDTMTPREVADALGIQVGGVRLYARRGLIRLAPEDTWYSSGATQHGRRPMYDRASVVAYLSRRTRRGRGPCAGEEGGDQR
jgi:hypothetical protein